MNQATEMSKEELHQRTSEIMESLKEQWEKAAEAGEDQLLHFFTATAYTLGSFVPFSMNATGYGAMTMTIVDSLTNGIQKSMEITGDKATMIKIVKE
ncbi:hypothetical protein AMS62_03285 [Bacillus sp. FJAT-18019]|nr:hypothetical protein AMS62_03285 [Bacillus sp. FJAT-18019]